MVARLVFPAAAWLLALPAFAQQPVQIDFVNIGGNDCPPCKVWRAVELPKLKAMPEFQAIRFTHVTKVIRSPVPPAMFFPAEIKHLQPALSEASNGMSGSPHQAFLVNGKVVDYWFGTGDGKGDAENIAAMIRALRDGTPPPRATCTKLKTQRTCSTPGIS